MVQIAPETRQVKVKKSPGEIFRVPPKGVNATDGVNKIAKFTACK
jgi:hypothetical protein